MSEQSTDGIVLEAHAKFMAEGFARLLGSPVPGTVTFVRCLSREVIDGLCIQSAFQIDGWDVQAVVGVANAVMRQITADQAVELREDKGDIPLLLLVDPVTAGAGMDGIYNASREIKEAELFVEAGKAAAKIIRHGWTTFARAAVRQAGRLGGRRGLSPWREFDFLTRCSVDSTSVGREVARLGLWPIKTGSKANQDDLALSALMVERLLLGGPGGRSAQARVDAIALDDASPQTRQALERFLREAALLPLDESVRGLQSQPTLWLNEIRLATGGGQLRAIEWMPWRGKNGAVGKWSGLIDQGEALPHFVMDADASTAKQLSRLEVRWSTHPPDLEKSAVEYRVTVVAGDDELAEKTVSQTDRAPQRAVFTNEDFNDLDEDARFEARVRIAAVGVDGVEPAESEEFLLYFGEALSPKGVTAGAGKPIRAVVEGAITLHDVAAFDETCSKEPGQLFTEDKKGYVLYRPQSGKGGFKVPRPPLIKAVEESWALNAESPGRWVVRVRADGSPVGGPSFVKLDRGCCPEEIYDRLGKASKRFCEDVMRGPGAVAKVYCGSVAAAEEYVNAWAAALERATSELSLSHTVEVQSLSGRTIGLVVLPTHPLRVAWHMAYDQLAVHARFELNMAANDVREVLATLDSAHFPSLLPGIGAGHSFVFGDTLGFHAVAMVRDDDNEPKAAISQIAACLAKDQPELTPSVGAQAAEVLAREIRKYVDHHDVHRLLLVHALRPGDGMTLGRALGKVAEPSGPTDDDATDGRQLGFVVELFTAEVERGQTGRFFTEVVERRRSGAGGLDSRDRWMLDSIVCEGGISLPRLRWAKREQDLPDRAAHVAVAFDTFASRVETVALGSQNPRPAQAYGLIAQPERQWSFGATPTWVSFQPALIDGEKHPGGKVLTDRLLRLQRAVLQTVAAHCGGDPGSTWPALVTKLSPEKRAALTRLHQLSDWVITVDRNAGIEYFDSPHEEGAVYDTYVIDCVPERDDLGSLQLITSTVRVDEVQGLLNETLGQMGLSSNPRNCRFLLAQLKALSGRLAIRLTNRNAAAGELIALAAVYANCLRSAHGTDDWLPVHQGFFVPLDDVRDLHPVSSRRKEQDADQAPNHRADLLFVTAGGRGGLRLCFVEVKYRRHLADAGDPSLVRDVVTQATGMARQWHDWYFEPRLPELTRNIRRGRLARALRFYVDKARRHDLSEEAHQRLVAEIDKMVRAGGDYVFSTQPLPNRGYIFCPEFGSDVPKELPVGDEAPCRVFVFGPNVLPELVDGTTRPPAPQPPQQPDDGLKSPLAEGEPVSSVRESTTQGLCPSQDFQAGDTATSPSATGLSAATLLDAAAATANSALEISNINLGRRVPGGDVVTWPVSIRSNPHLMVVGLPGMGKTTCLASICRQFSAAGVMPIVFSYHQDLDEKLAGSLDGVRFLDHGTLGFNPLKLADSRATAYVDTAGMLRDIFAAIFPEMGDIQTGKIRTAIKESYETLGWSAGTSGSTTPSFRDFYLKLKSEEKPDRGLLARLGELDDYGVFSGTADGRRLLDDVAPAVVQVHANQNELIQRAFASLILYSIYKDMFRRGPQGRLTHAVIFDEAHRASKLKLLPTMAKECRKYGISLVLASQEARDFDDSLYSAVANYLCLRVTENDAKTIARHCVDADLKNHTADRLKSLSKYEALFFAEGKKRPIHLALGDD